MTLPKLVILDRDGVLNFASSNPESPLYYVTKLEHVVIKPGVDEAIRLIEAHGIPIALVTKQRCISKGLVTREQVNLVNARVARLLELPFTAVFIEEKEEDKRKILETLISKAPVKPSDMVMFDDSPREVKIAQTLGIAAYDGTYLLEAVKQVLHIS